MWRRGEGYGCRLSGSVVFDDPSHGLSLNLEARRLIVHEEADFQEWGASLAASWDPYPTSDRNLSVLLTQDWGLLPSSGMDTRFSHESFAELITDNDRRNRFEASSRLVGEVGYGFPVLGALFTGTPNVGFGLANGDARDWRIGWRLNSELSDYRSFQLSLDATWRESLDKQMPAEKGVMIESVILW
ncbi:MAG: hypothetical protein F4W90_05305 [Gammaproteobacteria bacterium]|nr:hypothetical protein [Gammaproteobacteria bacterium]